MWDFLKPFRGEPREPLPPRVPFRGDDATIEAMVKEIVAEELDVEISLVMPESEWERDLGSSLDELGVFLRCQEEFGIDIPDEASERFDTVGKLTAYVQERLRSEE